MRVPHDKYHMTRQQMKWYYIPRNDMKCADMSEMIWYCMACHDAMFRDWELVRYDFEETARVHPRFINSWITLFCSSNLVWCKNIRDVARVVPDACNKWRILPFGESFGVDIAYILFMSEHHVCEPRNMSVHCVCMYSKMFREWECWNCTSSY